MPSPRIDVTNTCPLIQSQMASGEVKNRTATRNRDLHEKRKLKNGLPTNFDAQFVILQNEYHIMYVKKKQSNIRRNKSGTAKKTSIHNGWRKYGEKLLNTYAQKITILRTVNKPVRI